MTTQARGADGRFIALRASGQDAGASRLLRRLSLDADGLGRHMRRMSTLAVGAGAATAAAVIAIGKSAVQTEAEFGQTMNLIGAATGQTGDDLGRLSDLAIRMGADTAFSANEAADAMLELAKAGIDADTILRGGLEGTLTLAAAGGTDLAKASEIASNAMNAFSLSGKDMAAVAAALAGGANASTASVESLGMGLSQVGPGAVNAGLSLQETIAALSAFDQAGIKGSDAGTSLKTMLASLVPVSAAAAVKMDDLGINFVRADGSFKSITQVAQILKERLGGLSEEQRTLALRTIFGSDASRAAAVLMKEGAAGVRDYIKATNDQSAAQEMAEARMAGTAGALERLGGSAETAELLIGQALAPSVVKVADALGDRLVPATEDAISVAEGLAGAYDVGGIDGVVREVERLTGTQGMLVPVVEEVEQVLQGLWRILGEVAPAFADAAEELPPFLQPLTLAGEAVGIVADALEAIPDPLKTIGAQAAIAAAVLPRLQAAVTATTGAFTQGTASAVAYYNALRYGSQHSQAAAMAMGRMAGAAKTAAGIGGMVALTAGMNETNDTASALYSTLGGAALGASVGGPFGAIIGAAGGAATHIYRMNQETEATRSVFRRAGSSAEDYAASIDEITGAVTASTLAQAYEGLRKQSGLLATAQSQYGISARTMTRAAVGERDALTEVRTALRDGREYTLDYVNASGILKHETGLTREQLTRTTDVLRAQGIEWKTTRSGIEKGYSQKVLDALRSEGNALEIATREQRDRTAALQDFSRLQGKLPRRVVQHLQLNGVQPTVRAIAGIANRYDELDGKQIQAIIRASGVDTTVREVRKVAEQLKDTDKVKPDLQGYSRDFASQLNRVKTLVDDGSSDVRKQLDDGPRRARADLGPYRSSLGGGINGAQGQARGGGVSIGAAIGDGFVVGVASRSGAVQGAMRASVAGAIRAAKDEAQVRSPSRKTTYISEMMMRGLEDPMIRAKGRMGSASADLIRELVKGIERGNVPMKRVLAAVDAEVERTTQRVRALTQQRGSVVGSFTGMQTSIFATELAEDGSVSLDDMLQASVDERARARQLREDVQALIGMGISKQLLRQLKDQGASGLAQISALAGGTEAQVRLASQLSNQTAAAYGAAGVQVANQLYGSQLADARSEQRLARALAQAVDDAMTKREAEYVFRLRGDDLVATIRRKERNEGKGGRK